MNGVGRGRSTRGREILGGRKHGKEREEAIGPAKFEPSRLFPPILKDRGMVLTLERAKTFCEGREGLRPASEHHRDDG